MKGRERDILIPTVAVAGFLLLWYKRMMIALPGEVQMPFLVSCVIGFVAGGALLDWFRGRPVDASGVDSRTFEIACCLVAAAASAACMAGGALVFVAAALSGMAAAMGFITVFSRGFRALPYNRRGMAFAAVFFCAGLVNTSTDIAELPWLRVSGAAANLAFAAACAAAAAFITWRWGAVFKTRIAAIADGPTVERSHVVRLFVLAIGCFSLMYVAVSLKDSVAYPVAVESIVDSGFIRYVELPMWLVAGFVCDQVGRKPLFAACTLCALVGSAGLLAEPGSSAAALCTLCSYFCLIGFPTACVCLVLDISYYLPHPAYAGAFCFAPIVVGAGVGVFATTAMAGEASESLFLVSVMCLGLFAVFAAVLFKSLAAYQSALERATPVLEFPGGESRGNDISSIAERYGLTPRETEVLELVFRGLTVAQMAEELVVSKSTVKFHITNILRKTESSNRQEMLEKIGA